jgi:small subunit ribosomal protein S6
MPLYESVFVVRQDVPSTQVETMATTFGDIVTGMGGIVGKKEYWGLRNLAYRIKKNRKGHYMMLNLDASGDAVAEMQRNMSINEDVIRYMTVRVDALEEVPSAMMQKSDRGERGDRGDRGDRPRRERFGDRSDRGDRGERPRFARVETPPEPETPGEPQ